MDTTGTPRTTPTPDDYGPSDLDWDFLKPCDDPTDDVNGEQVRRNVPTAMALAPDESALYFGFKDGVKKFDLLTNRLSPTFVAATNAPVTAPAVTPDGRTLYAGGSFTQIGGAPRAGVARLDAATGATQEAFNAELTGGGEAGGPAMVAA